MNIVIIGHNEGEHVNSMLESLKEHLPYHKRIWVLDRCADFTENFLNIHREHIIKTDSTLEGRQTSYSRNLGLQACDPDQDVLFLDGDRYIVEGEFSPEEWKEDVALFKLQSDNRDNIHDYQKVYGTVHNGFYSCGLFIKRKAIDMILNFQGGYLFNEDIQNSWGIEDTYLGDVCYHLGLSCDLHPNIRLHGLFPRSRLDGLHILKTRLDLRNNLNVKW